MESNQLNNVTTRFKVALLGDYGVGKTSLRKRYLGDGFKGKYMSTLGADFVQVNYNNSKISLWDVAGALRKSIEEITMLLCNESQGAILIYDITRPETFYAIPNWIKGCMTSLRSNTPPPLVLVANKTDLRTDGDDSRVSFDEQYLICKGVQGLDLGNTFS